MPVKVAWSKVNEELPVAQIAPPCQGREGTEYKIRPVLVEFSAAPPGGLASAFGCLEALYLLHPRRTPLYTTVRGAYMHGDAPMALITYAMLIVCLAPDR